MIIFFYLYSTKTHDRAWHVSDSDWKFILHYKRCRWEQVGWLLSRKIRADVKEWNKAHTMIYYVISTARVDVIRILLDGHILEKINSIQSSNVKNRARTSATTHYVQALYTACDEVIKSNKRLSSAVLTSTVYRLIRMGILIWLLRAPIEMFIKVKICLSSYFSHLKILT